MSGKRNRVADEQRRAAVIARTGSVSIANSVLTLEKVTWVKQMLMEGRWGRREIGQAVGVSTESIAKIARGDTWAHVPWPDGVDKGELVAPDFGQPVVQRVPVPATGKDSLALVLEKLGPGYKPVDAEDPNEVAKRKLLGGLNAAVEDAGAGDTPVNLDELP